MELNSQLAMCNEYYSKWKDIALRTSDKKALERAFFWLELQAAFSFLWALEQSKDKNKELKKKIILAKSKLSEKLAKYADEILNEIK